LLPEGKAGITYCMIQRDTPVPPSRQLAALIRAQIDAGQLAPGERIPSILVLAETHGISPVTVRKGLSILKDEGLLFTVNGYGTFVRE
jgi:DNA-binding GntR family transcriptional regulator